MGEQKSYHQTLAKKRMSAGALFFDEAGDLLLVKPTYKREWLIPGGVVDANESPRQACMREIREELGLDWTPGRLLCVDYTAEGPDNTEALRFVFLGGTLLAEQIAQIQLPESELCEYRFWEPAEGVALLVGKQVDGLPFVSLFSTAVKSSTLKMKNRYDFSTFS